MKFETFKSKSTGVIARYPAHYATHPVFGHDLELYTPGEEVEEDKTVVDSHEIPVDQRVRRTARKTETDTGEKE